MVERFERWKGDTEIREIGEIGEMRPIPRPEGLKYISAGWRSAASKALR